MKTTLNIIRAHSPCVSGWEKLLRHLGKTQADDEPLPLLTVLESNGLGDALWCLQAIGGHDREIRLYAVWCARQVQHLMTDPRSLTALDVAADFANGLAGEDELEAARAADRDADQADWADRDADWDADWAARYASWAASGAAWAATSAAARAADRAATSAADRAARTAASDAQAAELRRVCQAIESGQDPYPTA